MTQLTFIKHQSWSKVGTIAGLVGGHILSGGNRFFGDLLGVVGTIVGAFVSMPAEKMTIDNSADIKQLDILRDHFSQFGLEKLNPIETNYNLYKRDCISDCFSLFESLKNKIMSKFTTVEEKTCYRNKLISEKYIVFDTFHDTDVKSIILDIAPLGVIGGLNSYKSFDQGKSLVKISCDAAIKSLIDIAIIYGSKPIINYILYTQDNLHDYERVEIEFNKHEIPLFQECLPDELAAEVVRVSA